MSQSNPSWCSAGVLIIRPRVRPLRPHRPLPASIGLPSTLLSSSACIGAQFPGPYALDWCSQTEAERAQAFAAIALPPHRRQAAQTWAQKQFGQTYGWPGVFYCREGAIAAKHQFFPHDPHVHVIGLGLPAEFRTLWMAAANPPPPQPGFAPVGKSGCLEVIEGDRPLPPGGMLLGYELLNWTWGQIGCSWLCNGLEHHCAETLGIGLNDHGLIDTLAEAKQCCREIKKPAVGAEPGLWLPLALVQF